MRRPGRVAAGLGLALVVQLRGVHPVEAELDGAVARDAQALAVVQPGQQVRVDVNGDGPRPVGRGPSHPWRVKGSNLRRLSRQIYSLLPLTTRATRLVRQGQ